MEEVRLWKILQPGSSTPRVEKIEGVQTVTAEKMLEEVLAHSPEVLMDDLTIIGRQNDTAGGPLDLLGVDEDGKLVVFELKRGELTRDAVAQVVDYASWISSLDAEELSEHVSSMSGRYGTEKIENFSDWYRENYDGKGLSDIGKPRMVLVGLGADDKTKRMVEFLSTATLDISLITFYGFNENGQTLLARKVEVEARTTKETTKYRETLAANEEKFRVRLKDQGIEPFYSKLIDGFRTVLANKGTVYPNANGHTFYFPDQTDAGRPSSRAYAGLSLRDSPNKVNHVVLTLQQRVVNSIDPQNLEQLAGALGATVERRSSSGQVDFVLDATKPVPSLESALAKVAGAVVDSWEQRRRSFEAQSKPPDTV